MRIDPVDYLEYLRKGSAKVWGLLVGNDVYQDERLRPLSFAASDCRALKKALQDITTQFPQSKLMDYYGHDDIAVTKQDICVALECLVKEVKASDTIFVYFACHGEVDSKDEQLYLCLTDTNLDSLAETGLGVKYLLNQLGQCKAEQQVVVMDACHSGNAIGQIGSLPRGNRSFLSARSGEISDPNTSEPNPKLIHQLKDDLNQYVSQRKNFCALLSCSDREFSWEIPELGGAFTHHLVKGMQGDAANSQGLIETNSLFEYVRKETSNSVRVKLQERQNPDRVVRGNNIILGLKSTRFSEDSFLAPPNPGTSPDFIHKEGEQRFIKAFCHFFLLEYPQISTESNKKLNKLVKDWYLNTSQVEHLTNKYSDYYQRQIDPYLEKLDRFLRENWKVSVESLEQLRSSFGIRNVFQTYEATLKRLESNIFKAFEQDCQQYRQQYESLLYKNGHLRASDIVDLRDLQLHLRLGDRIVKAIGQEEKSSFDQQTQRYRQACAELFHIQNISLNEARHQLRTLQRDLKLNIVSAKIFLEEEYSKFQIHQARYEEILQNGLYKYGQLDDEALEEFQEQLQDDSDLKLGETVITSLTEKIQEKYRSDRQRYYSECRKNLYRSGEIDLTSLRQLQEELKLGSTVSEQVQKEVQCEFQRDKQIYFTTALADLCDDGQLNRSSLRELKRRLGLGDSIVKELDSKAQLQFQDICNQYIEDYKKRCHGEGEDSHDLE
jgi:hypothetical protein